MLTKVLLCVFGLAICSAFAQICPDGTHPVNCFVQPCQMARCPGHPDARCVDDYCGGCNYYFVSRDGTVLTDAACSSGTAA